MSTKTANSGSAVLGFQENRLPQKGAGSPVLESDHNNYPLQEFGGMNTQADRTSIDDKQFGWLENLIPIGRANMKTIPSPGPNLATINSAGTGTINYGVDGYILNAPYTFNWTNEGALWAFNIQSSTAYMISGAGTFSDSGISACMWGNTYLLIVDPIKGYFIWDGQFLYGQGNIFAFTITDGGSGYTSAPTVSITGGSGSGAAGQAVVMGGVVTAILPTNLGTGYLPTDTLTVGITGGGGSNATATVSIMQWNAFGAPLPPGIYPYIAVKYGTLFILANRNIIVAAGGTVNDFALADGGGFFPIQDSYHKGPMTGMIAGNDYIYLRSASAVDVITGVNTTTVNNSVTTTISRSNVSTNIGSDLQYAEDTFLRSYILVSRYGVYGFFGQVPEKISDDMDGIWMNLDFTKPVLPGQVTIYNKLCFYVSATYIDPQLGSRPIFMLWYEKKWFISSQSVTTTFVISTELNGSPSVYGTDGTHIFQYFSNNIQGLPWRLSTKLYDFGQPLADKEGIAMAAYVDTTVTAADVLIYEESEYNRYVPEFYNFQWSNNVWAHITWVNNSGAEIDFYSQPNSQAVPYSFLTNPINWTGAQGNAINWVNNNGVGITFFGTGFYEYFAPMTTKTKYLGFTLIGDDPQVQIAALGIQFDYASLMSPSP